MKVVESDPKNSESTFGVTSIIPLRGGVSRTDRINVFYFSLVYMIASRCFGVRVFCDRER
jgi:hypothetical protein